MTRCEEVEHLKRVIIRLPKLMTEPPTWYGGSHVTNCHKTGDRVDR